MADQTPEEINAALIATAAAYNSQNPTGDSAEDAAAQAAAHELNQATGSRGHDGTTEIHADTPEEISATEAKAAEEAAAAEEAKTDEEKAADAKAKEEADAKAKAEAEAAETPEDKAKREEAEAASQKEIDDAGWMTTDNKQFNASLNLMKAAGMKPAEAAEIFDEAAQSGDLSKVDQAALIEKVGEDQAALIMAGFTNYVETEGQAILERVSMVHDAVGGTENFAVMSKWARGKAKGDPAFRTKIENITEMMNGGNEYQADLAAKDFLRLYNDDGSNSSIAPKAAAKEVNVTAAKTAPAKSTANPITAREFAEKSDNIMRTMRGAEQAAALKSLSADRAAGRNKGI